MTLQLGRPKRGHDGMCSVCQTWWAGLLVTTRHHWVGVGGPTVKSPKRFPKFPKSAIQCVFQGAVPLVLSSTPWDISLSLSILPLLPCEKSHIMKHLTTWLRIHAIWQYDAYTSWHLPFPQGCDSHYAVWCHDYPILKQMHTPPPLPTLDAGVMDRWRLQPWERRGQSLMWTLQLDHVEALAYGPPTWNEES